MRYTFTSPIYTEANRAFGGIPFNVWEETGLKGNIPSLVSISGLSFECKLIPRGGRQISDSDTEENTVGGHAWKRI